VSSRELDEAVDVTLWSPDGLSPDEPAALLVVHDGPEYDALASLTAYASAMVTAGRLPLPTNARRPRTSCAPAAPAKAIEVPDNVRRDP
jgi:hypothetical protein